MKVLKFDKGSLKDIDDFVVANQKYFEGNNLRQECVSFLENVLIFRQTLIAFDKKSKKLSSNRKDFLDFKRKMDVFFRKAEIFDLKIANIYLSKRVKWLFRELLKDILMKSRLVKHGLIKPRGYPGDYRIVDAMYNNVPVTSSGIGHYLDRYFLSNDYVQAVRDRKDSMKKILSNFIKFYPGREVNILNLACGSSRDVYELFSDYNFPHHQINLTLLDQDKTAIEFSRSRLRNLRDNIQVRYVTSDFVEFIRKKSKNIGQAKFNLIYSIGLADYLPDSFLSLMFKFGLQLLSNEGQLIIAHKNTFYYSSPISDWGADWKFIPRTKQHVRSLVKNCLQRNDYKLSFSGISNKHIFYICIKRI